MEYTRMQQRRDTAANWTDEDPVLASGEIGVETGTWRFKVGDGVSSWTELPYFANELFINAAAASAVNAQHAADVKNFIVKVNVLNHGAVGDGVADDTEAIQEAIAEAEALVVAVAPGVLLTSKAAIYLPRPTVEYRTTAPLLITKDHIEIYGESMGVIIHNTTNDSDVFRVDTGTAASLRGAFIHDLTLRGTGTGSRAIYGDQLAHFKAWNISTMEHPGPTTYLESTGSNLLGCAFSDIRNVLAQPSQSISCFVDIGGINNHYSECRAREGTVGFDFTNCTSWLLENVYVETNNRPGAQTGMRIRTTSGALGADQFTKKTGTINIGYFENNPVASVDSDGGTYVRMIDCHTPGGLTGSLAKEIVRLDGGGWIENHRGVGGTAIRSAKGIVAARNCDSIYGRPTELAYEGAVLPVTGSRFINAATTSWFDTAATWSKGGTNPTADPTYDNSTFFYGLGSMKTTFTSGGNGYSYARVNILNALLSAVVGDHYTTILAFKASRAGEAVGIRHVSSVADNPMLMETDTAWQIAIRSTLIRGAGNVFPSLSLAADVASDLDVWVGAVGAGLRNNVGLLNTSVTAPTVGGIQVASGWVGALTGRTITATTVTATGSIEAPAGSAAAPGVRFGDASTGVYRPSPSQVALAAGGNQILTVSAGAAAIASGRTFTMGGPLDHDGTTAGFYGTTPVAKQTGVAVTPEAIHAALVSLGLIAA